MNRPIGFGIERYGFGQSGSSSIVVRAGEHRYTSWVQAHTLRLQPKTEPLPFVFSFDDTWLVRLIIIQEQLTPPRRGPKRLTCQYWRDKRRSQRRQGGLWLRILRIRNTEFLLHETDLNLHKRDGLHVDIGHGPNGYVVDPQSSLTVLIDNQSRGMRTVHVAIRGWKISQEDKGETL